MFDRIKETVVALMLLAALAGSVEAQYQVPDVFGGIANRTYDRMAPRGYARLDPVSRANIYRRQQLEAKGGPMLADAEEPTKADAADAPKRHVVRTAAPSRPSSAKTADSSTSSSSPLEDRSAAVSKRLAASDKQLRESVLASRQALHEALAAQKKEPKLDEIQGAYRHQLFTSYLGNVAALGRGSINNVEGLKQLFYEYRGVNEDAVKVFGEAADHFQERSLTLKDPRAKGLSGRISSWYATRAETAEAARQVPYPQDFDEKLAGIRETVETCEEFHRFLLKDPDFFAQGEVLANLALLFESVNDISAVLDTWTEDLLKNLERQKKSARPPQQDTPGQGQPQQGGARKESVARVGTGRGNP